MHSIDSVIYTNSIKAIEDYDLILFYFNYPKLMHLGDHLYFKPLVSKLCANNYKVKVEPVKSLEFLFHNCFIDTTKINFASKKVLFVSRLELLPEITNKFGDVDYFLYDTMSYKINLPISNFIVNSFAEYYQLTNKLDLLITANEYLNFVIKPYNKFDLTTKNGIIFLSNYVDSGRFRILPKRKKLLIKKMQQERRDYHVVHLGTKNDAFHDHNDYKHIVDLDLRGKTTPEDIFSLMAMKNVISVYCHDTYILHVANIFDLPINVVFKKYFVHNVQKRKTFSSLFAKQNDSNIIFL